MMTLFRLAFLKYVCGINSEMVIAATAWPLTEKVLINGKDKPN